VGDARDATIAADTITSAVAHFFALDIMIVLLLFSSRLSNCNHLEIVN